MLDVLATASYLLDLFSGSQRTLEHSPNPSKFNYDFQPQPKSIADVSEGGPSKESIFASPKRFARAASNYQRPRYSLSRSTLPEFRKHRKLYRNLGRTFHQMTKPRVKSRLEPMDNLNKQGQKGLGNILPWTGRSGDSNKFISARNTLSGDRERSSKRRKVNDGSKQRSQVELSDEPAEATQYERTTHRHSPTQPHGIVQALAHGQAPLRKDNKPPHTDLDTHFTNHEYHRINERIQARQDSRNRKLRESQERHPYVDLRPQPNAQGVSKQIDLTTVDPFSPKNRRDSTVPDQDTEDHARRRKEETRFRPAPAAQQLAKAQQQQNRRELSSQPSVGHKSDVPADPKQLFSRKSDLPNDNTRCKFKRDVLDDSDVDELQGSTTVGLHSKPAFESSNLVNNARQPSPNADQGNPSFSSIDDGPSANIEPTLFSNSGPRKNILAPSAAKVKRPRQEKPFACPIETFWSSEFGEIPSPDLLLYHDHNSNDFYVRNDQEPSQQDGAPFPLVKCGKVRKVAISQEGRSLSIDGPRIGNVDYIVDITFINRNDMEEFVRVLKAISKGTLPILEKSLDYFRGLFLNHQRNKATIHHRPHADGANADKSEIYTPSRGPSSKQGDHRQADHRQEVLSEQAPKKRRITENLQQDIKYEEHDELTNRDSARRSSTQPRIVNDSLDSQRAIPFQGRERREGLRNSTRQTAPGKYSTLDSLDEISESERFSRKYGLGEVWDQSVIYPEIGAKRSTVDFLDLKRLDEGEFLNDNLIAFYLRYCEEAFQAKQVSEKPKVYFFSNFFFSALSTSDKGTKGFNYKAVQRWTSKVDIFDFDYIIVPINEDLHWYVAIICNLPNLGRKLVRTDSEEAKERNSDNTILGPLEKHLDAAQEAQEPASQSSKNANIADGLSSNVVPSLEADMNKLSTRSPSDKVGRQYTNFDDKAAATQLAQESEEALAGHVHLTEEGDSSSFSKVEARAEEKPQHGSSASSEKKSRRKSGLVRKSNAHEPTIIVLDSIDVDRFPTRKLLKEYLIAEGKSRRSMDISSKDIQGINAKHIPTQDNYCDCGLYLLGYVSRFLEEPQDFVRKIVSRQHIDFPELNPGIMRTNIKKLLQNLYKEQKNARDQKLEARGKLKNVKIQGAQKGKTREGGQQNTVETRPQLQHQSPPKTSIVSVPSDQKLKDEISDESPPVPVRRSVSPSKTAESSVSQPTRGSGSPVKAPELPDAAPLLSKNASSRQGSKSVIRPESQCLLHESQQPESLEDSVVFVSEQAVPKQVSPPQRREDTDHKRAGAAITSRKRLDSNLPRAQEDGESSGRYRQGLDIITQLREAAEDEDRFKAKRKQRSKMQEATQAETLEETQEVTQEGEEEEGQGGGHKNDRGADGGSEEDEVEVILESPVG